MTTNDALPTHRVRNPFPASKAHVYWIGIYRLGDGGWAQSHRGGRWNIDGTGRIGVSRFGGYKPIDLSTLELIPNDEQYTFHGNRDSPDDWPFKPDD